MEKAVNTNSIVVISHGLNPHYTADFVNALAENGMEVTLLGGDNLKDEQLHGTVTRKLFRGDADKDTNRSLQKKIGDVMRYHFSIILYLLSNKHKSYHIIGLYKFFLLRGIIEPLLFRIVARRCILTVHNILPHDEETLFNFLRYWVAYRVPNRLVVHTKKARIELIERFGIKPGNVRLMHHGLNEQIERYESLRQARQRLGIAADAKVLLFFGLIRPYKGLDLLLNVFDSFDESYVLIVAGRVADSSYGRRIEQMIARNANNRRLLFFRGFIPDRKVSTIFAATDYLILPYRKIDQSGVLFLSLALGVRFIASDVGEFGEYVGAKNEYGVIIPELSEQSLKKTIETAVKEPNYDRDQIIADVQGSYAWRTTIRSTLDLY